MSVVRFQLTITDKRRARRPRTRTPKKTSVEPLTVLTERKEEPSGPSEPPVLSVDEEVDALFDTASSICAQTRAIGGVETETEAVCERILELVRRSAHICRRRGVEVACMVETLREERIDVEVAAHRIIERQRMLRANGRINDAQLLSDAMSSARKIEQQMAKLHPHVLFSAPAAIYINSDIKNIADRLSQ